ncbi:MAG TPA: hypothetical protein VET65_04555, partial [Candidatus Limnocylindrales bacterium]|nr:hypothetical protein [Candidatus Limnocylindrales bacterium]
MLPRRCLRSPPPRPTRRSGAPPGHFAPPDAGSRRPPRMLMPMAIADRLDHVSIATWKLAS